MHRHLFNPSLSLKSIIALWLGAVLACAPLVHVTAMESDKQQPVVVTADRSEYSEALQQQTLIGNVFVMQGSLKVRADKIIIYLKAGALDHFDASGQPTTFEQLDDNNQLVTGQANRIEYSATSDQAVFTGAAKLENPKQSLSGNRIDYNMATQAASAEMDEAGKQQVHIIIQPSTNQNQ